MSRPLRAPRPYSVLGAIVAINAKLAYCATLGMIAWAIWPSSPEWWGFGFLAILISAGALGLSIKTLLQTAQLILRDRATRAYQRLGADPNPAELASSTDLRRAGMIDG